MLKISLTWPWKANYDKSDTQEEMIHNQGYHFVGNSQENRSGISNFRESDGIGYERFLALCLFLVVLPIFFQS